MFSYYDTMTRNEFFWILGLVLPMFIINAIASTFVYRSRKLGSELRYWITTVSCILWIFIYNGLSVILKFAPPRYGSFNFLKMAIILIVLCVVGWVAVLILNKRKAKKMNERIREINEGK